MRFTQCRRKSRTHRSNSSQEAATPSSTPCQPRPAMNASLIICSRSRLWTQKSPSFRQTGSGREGEEDQILPFVRCFYGTPSTYLWDDEMGVTQHIHQEGGSKATPSRRCSSHLGNTQLAAQERLPGNELLFAYLDDVHAVCRPDRVGAIFAIFIGQGEFVVFSWRTRNMRLSFSGSPG